jgi:hypothetical protein
MFKQLNTLLNRAIRADPLLCLAQSVCWLDPLWWSDDDEVYGDPLATGLLVAREAFPDVYAGAVERIRTGATDNEIDRYLCAEISKQGIPVDDLEALGYGIPLPAYGVRLDDPDFHESHPDVLPILALFGAEEAANEIDLSERVYKVGRLLHERLIAHDDPAWKQVGWALGWLYSCSGNSSVLCGIEDAKSSRNLAPEAITVPEQAYTVGRILAEDLANHLDVRYRQVAWLLKWLFSCSGNSCVDWDEETMFSVEPLSWTPDDIAFAIAMLQEADAIMTDVQSARDWLQNTPVVLVGLVLNGIRLSQALKKDPQKTPRLTFFWPDPEYDRLEAVLQRMGMSDGAMRVT